MVLPRTGRNGLLLARIVQTKLPVYNTTHEFIDNVYNIESDMVGSMVA